MSSSPYVIRYWISAGHSVMVFHQGQTQANLPSTVTYLQSNRQNLRQYQSQIQAFAPDAVLDRIPYIAADAQTMLDTIASICPRIRAISSQDVYRGRDILWGSAKTHPKIISTPPVQWPYSIQQ